MKSMIIAAFVAVSAPSPLLISGADGNIFVLRVESLRGYENVKGVRQVDMLVDLSSFNVVSRNRVGVAGCESGKGQIARVDGEGNPIAPAQDWVAGGGRVSDVMAVAICLASKPDKAAPTAAGVV